MVRLVSWSIVLVALACWLIGPLSGNVCFVIASLPWLWIAADLQFTSKN
jgi:hypothetical protein